VFLLVLGGVVLLVAGAAAQPRGTGVEYERIRGLADWFQRGGFFMWPLLACSILGLAIVLERFARLRRLQERARTEIRGVLHTVESAGIEAAVAYCRRSGGPVARTLHAGLTRADLGIGRVERALESAGGIEVAFLKRGLLWLATIANIAPLLGFLGTVSGMIHAFATIAGADQISARLVASGIEEALITTEAGLCIAIPIQAFHNYFVGRIDGFITEIEAGALDLLGALERQVQR
jgi:biopolymer transport protein ExbB